MKCKICGHRTNTLQAMNKHYAKAHPGAKKKRKKKEKNEGGSGGASPEPSVYSGGIRYCPRCGERIGG